MKTSRNIIFFTVFAGVLTALSFVAWRVIAGGLEETEAREAARRVQLVRQVLVARREMQESRGKLVAKGSIASSVWQQVSQGTGTRLALRSLSDNKLPSDFNAVRTHVVKAPVTVNSASGSVVTYLPVYSTTGKPASILRIEAPPTFAGVRQKILWTYIARIGVMLLFLAGCFSALLKNRAAAESPVQTPVVSSEQTTGNEMERLRREHQESEELFRQMAINASDVLYAMYPDSGRLDWYGQIDLLLGYAHGSFPRTITAWAESIHPDEAESIIDLYSRACATGDSFAVEYRMRHRNGSYRDWSHRGKPLFDKSGDLMRVIGSCSDVTESRRAQRRLRESEERLARIFETVADAIVLCDREGKITFANPAAELVFGVDNKEIVGSNYGDERWKITRPDGAPLEPYELPSAFVVATGQPVHNIENSLTHPSGRIVVASVNAAPLHDAVSGELTGAVLSLTDITGRKALEDRLSFQAFHDPLTKLPNRALFIDRLGHAIVRAARSKTFVSVFFIDLDNFKKTNDTLGHDAGDELLITTARRICASIRGGDTAARLGGDEFTILLENISEVAQAQVVADRLLKAMLETVPIKGQDVYAPPSIGIALGRPEQTPDEVMADADAAMYLAKQNGKARYEFFEPQSVPKVETQAVASS